MRNRHTILLALLLSLTTAVWSAGTEELTTIEKLGTLFQRIDERENLFEVSAQYVLQPGLNAKGELTQVRVVPKYFFETSHPEWQEPESPSSIPVEVYRDTVQRLANIKRLGALVHPGKVGVTLNLQTSFWDEYSQGIVERTVFRKSPQEEYGISRFTLYYLHRVKGRVDAKEVTLSGPRVQINGKWYWIPMRTLKTLTVGRQESIQAAGPLSKGPPSTATS